MEGDAHQNEADALDDDSIHDIIDPNEFFAAVDAIQGDEDLDAQPDDEDADVELLNLPDEVLEERIEEYYREDLQPLIEQLYMSHSEREASQFQYTSKHFSGALFIYADIMWLTLILHDGYLQEFIDALLFVGKHNNHAIKSAYFFWPTTVFGLMELPWNEIRTCMLCIGKALATCKNINAISLQLLYHANFGFMDKTVARMLRLVRHVEKLILGWDRTDEEPSPSWILAVVGELPQLNELEFGSHDSGLWISHVCRAAMNCRTLGKVHLVCDNEGSLFPWTMIEAEAFARLLQQGRIIDIFLQSVRFVDNEVSRLVGNAIGEVTSLCGLCLVNVLMDEDEIYFYGSLGIHLPSMKHLSCLVISVSKVRDEEVRFRDNACLAAVLFGASRLPALHHLSLHHYAWTPILGAALADFLALCTSLRDLRITGAIISPGNETAFSALTNALKNCSLACFCCKIEAGMGAHIAAVDIARGIGASGIKDCTLSASGTVSAKTICDVFKAFHDNLTLEKLWLYLEVTPDGQDGTLSESCLESILESIQANAGIETLMWYPKLLRSDEQKYRILAFTRIISELNRLGRRYIRKPNDPNFGKEAVRVIGAVDSVDTLFVHLQEVPTLFHRQKGGTS